LVLEEAAAEEPSRRVTTISIPLDISSPDKHQEEALEVALEELQLQHLM
jgi:hypothetical protein